MAKSKKKSSTSKSAAKKKKVASKAVAAQPKGLTGWAKVVGNTRMAVGLIMVFSLLLYANTLTHEYAQDDAIVITDNMFTQKGLAGIPGILQYDTFYGFFKEEGKANLVAGGRYRPLTLVMFAIEVQLFGQSPFIGHLGNILLYGLTGVVLYLLLLQLLPREKSPWPYFVALATSLLFIAHPIHTEAVANIKGRDEIVTLLGSLAAVYYSIRAYNEGKLTLNILAGVLFFLALLAKENAITFLAVVPFTYYFFTKAKGSSIFLQTLPFLAGAGLFLILRFSILQGASISDTSMELMNNPFIKIVDNRYVPMEFGERMATVMFTLGKYIQLLIFPHPLTHDYYPRQIAVMSWGDYDVLLSLVVYLGLGVYAIRGLLKKDPLAYCILYFLITLSIVSNILFPVGTNMSERFVFMPSVGFCLALAILIFNFFKDKEKGSTFNMASTIVGVVIILFSIMTIVRNPVWKNNYTLFTSDISHSPNSAKLRNAVGGELIAQALKVQNEAQKQNMLQEANGHLQEAIRIHPNFKNAYLLLGNCNNYLKNYEASIQYYQKAIELDPGYEEAINNLAITYRDAGRFYGETQNNLVKSLEYLEKAYSMDSKDYETLRLLGVAYGMSQQPARAVEFFNKALSEKPDDANALYNLGTAYYNAGNPALGQEYRQKAIAIDPSVGQQPGQ